MSIGDAFCFFSFQSIKRIKIKVYVQNEKEVPILFSQYDSDNFNITGKKTNIPHFSLEKESEDH